MLYIRRVAGISMLPTYDVGQLILAIRIFRKLRLHDVVIIHHDGHEKIKRITEIEGSRLYVRGDNPRHSTDSRHFGWIDRRQVTARVIYPRNKFL